MIKREIATNSVIIEKGGVDLLMQIMKIHQKDPEVQSEAFNALRSIIGFPKQSGL